jgi:lipopolysaccharide export LptBFGC system permease protein LptF
MAIVYDLNVVFAVSFPGLMFLAVAALLMRRVN